MRCDKKKKKKKKVPPDIQYIRIATPWITLSARAPYPKLSYTLTDSLAGLHSAVGIMRLTADTVPSAVSFTT